MPLWFQTRTRYSEDVTNLKFAKHEGTWAESTIIINSMMVLGKLDLTISRAIVMICNATDYQNTMCPNAVRAYRPINHQGYDMQRY